VGLGLEGGLLDSGGCLRNRRVGMSPVINSIGYMVER
jgi:hypothetical protein